MKRNSANHGIIASGSIITVLEVLIQLSNLEPATVTALASLAPILGGAIAWGGNKLFLYFSLPEHLMQQDALLAQTLRMLQKDLKCNYTTDEKKVSMRGQIEDIKEARRKIRLDAAQLSIK